MPDHRCSLRPGLRLAMTCLVATMMQAACFADKEDPLLAPAALGVLKTQCYRCHGLSQKLPDFNVLDLASLTKPRGNSGDQAFVVPGDLGASVLWDHIDGDDANMPPSGSPEAETMSLADRDVLRRWIESGAAF